MTELSSQKLAELCAQYGAAKKAEDVLSMDLREVTEIADFFVVCTALSDNHARAICNEIREKLKENHDEKVWHVEGYEHGKWILLDFVSVVVHIFQKEYRDYYSLERLWGDAEIIYWTDEMLEKEKALQHD